MKNQSILFCTALYGTAYATVLPNLLQGRDMNAPPTTLPAIPPYTSSAHCYYDTDCPAKCEASPNLAWCQQSIDGVCQAVAAAKPNATRAWFIYDTGNWAGPPYGYDLVQGKDHCLAIAIASDLVTQFPSFEACQQSFQSIGGCAEQTHPGYNPGCVGGSINLQTCTGSPGALFDESRLAYVLGSPAELALLATPRQPGVASQNAEVTYIAQGQNNITVGPYAL